MLFPSTNDFSSTQKKSKNQEENERGTESSSLKKFK
jgi:hypothetical protein